MFLLSEMQQKIYLNILQGSAFCCWTDSMGFVCLVTLNESDKDPFNWVSVLIGDRLEQQSILSLIRFFFNFLLSQIFCTISCFLHLSRLTWHSWNSAIPVNHEDLRPLPENRNDQHSRISAVGTSVMSAAVDGTLYKLH